MENKPVKGLEEFFASDNFVVPTFLTGDFGKRVFEAYRQKVEDYGKKHGFRLEVSGKEIIRINFQDNALVDSVVKPFGFRTATLSDFNNFLGMVEGNYHMVAAGDLAFRSVEDSYSPTNEIIAGKIVELCGVDLGKITKTPALVRGLGIEPSDNDYGWVVQLTGEPNVIYDERLLGKFNGWRFDHTDELGLPEKLDKLLGDRVWYTKDEGIARFNLGRCRFLSSVLSRFEYCEPEGRIGIVADTIN